RLALNRGIPFGDIGGLLRGGDPNAGGGRGTGPGGPGRGGVFGRNPGGAPGGANTHIHIVYLLDVSFSMHQGNKIGKAQEALKQALSELRPADTFDVIIFGATVDALSPVLLPASPDNISEANAFIDNIRLRSGTNISGALEAGLSLEGTTHLFLLSDGEPAGAGLQDPDQIRALVRELNTRKVQINTLALGLGEQFRGMALLKALADDNHGKYAYINLARIPSP